MIFNVDRAGDIVKTLAMAKRYGIKPVIAGGAEAWVVADQLAKALGCSRNDINQRLYGTLKTPMFNMKIVR